MTKLPPQTFTDVLADLERYEHTRALADALTAWLTALHRTPDDVHSFSLEAENSLGAYIFCLETQCGPGIDAMVTFKDESKEKTRFSLAGQGMTWGDLLGAMKA